MGANNMPVEPTELLFKTKPKDYTKLNAKAFDELLSYFPAYYSYADLKKVDWNNEFKNRKKAFIDGHDNGDFAATLLPILKKADDPHMWIELNGKHFNSGRMKIVTPNYGRMNEVYKKLTDMKFTKTFEFVGGKLDSAGYIMIKGWNFDIQQLTLNIWGTQPDSTVSVQEFLSELSTLPNLIIDVRQNGGGNEKFAKDFASFFITDSMPYEKTILRDSLTGKFDVENTKWLYPGDFHLNYTGNIYVLSGPNVMSSNESFILMMKQIPNTKVVGMKTYGSSGNPKPYELSNGIKMFIPSWKAYTLDGQLIEGNGIAPDIEFVSKAMERTRENLLVDEKDALIEKVFELIRGEKENKN